MKYLTCSFPCFSPALQQTATLTRVSSKPALHSTASLLASPFTTTSSLMDISTDSYIASSLIHFYAKFGHVERACKVFDAIPERNVVPWTAIIGCYSRAGDACRASCLFNEMRFEGIEPSSVTLLSLLSGDLELAHVRCLHGCAVLYGFEGDRTLVNSMINAYGKCMSVDDSMKLFELMEEISWNSLISSHANVGNAGEILHLMRKMKAEGMDPDHQTFGCLVSAITMTSNLEMGKLVHGQILRADFNLNVPLETSLMVMYQKCGNVDVAIRIFEQNPNKDVISWTAMISGLVQNDCADKALVVFSQLLKSSLEPSTATIASALAACAQLNSFTSGMSIHGYILRQGMGLDIPVQNALISLYAKCGYLEQSCAVFDRMSRRDLVSWNAIIAGCAQNGDLNRGLSLFNKMRRIPHRPDSITVVTLLQACASIGVLQQGRWIQNFVIRNCLSPCVLVDTALIDMYSKCGDLDAAQKCFDQMLQCDLISWSTIIAGYGCHGKGDMALRLYSDFLLTGIEPNHVIFLSVLSACSHSGLVDEGLTAFASMKKLFRIQPKLEHRACVVDLLCRAGRVEEAHNFYRKNFPEPSVDVLGILLDACRSNGNEELGDMIVREILTLKPADAGNYVQLARSYAANNRWDGMGEALTQMKSLGLKKLPGWSYVELNGTITTFFTQQISHPLHEQIVSSLTSLRKEMRKTGMINEAFQAIEIT